MTLPTVGQPPESPLVNNIVPQSCTNQQWHLLPQRLKQYDQWVLAGPDKIPLGVRNGKLFNAKVTSPSDWMPYETAIVQAASRQLDIGFVLSDNDPFTCIDLDIKDAQSHPDTPQVWTTQDDWDRYISMYTNFDSYTERSRSGKGLHIWIEGDIGRGFKRDGVEVYSRERFIICTGDVLINKPIANKQMMVTNMVTQMRPKVEKFELEVIDPIEDDWCILERGMEAENKDKFIMLWKGNWQNHYKSQSEADMALMSMLTFYSESNSQVRRIFRKSGLGQREKATKNNRYINDTLRKIRLREHDEKAADISAISQSLELRFGADETICPSSNSQPPSVSFTPKTHPTELPDQVRQPRNFLTTSSAPPLDPSNLPEVVQSFVTTYSNANGFDQSAVIMAAIVAAAAMIDDDCKLRVKSNWRVSPRLWAVIIGKSASGKSPILKATSAPIKALHMELARNFKESYQPDLVRPHERPPEPAIFSSDATVEALSEKLKTIRAVCLC
jgi:hypothetical protein